MTFRLRLYFEGQKAGQMKRDKYTCKTDSNQAEIVKALRDYGCSVTPIHMVGGGCPDLLCGIKGKNILLEVKGKGKLLNNKEALWFGSWKGQAEIVYSPEGAIMVIEEETCK
jgi:hypothetical protein